MVTAATTLALIDTQARALNTIYTWGRARGMRASHLVDAADVELATLAGLDAQELIEARNATTGDLAPIHGSGTPYATVEKYRIHLTAKGRQWVEQPPNMLLRAIDLAGRTGLALHEAQEIAGDSRIIRWAVDEGYATFHYRDEPERPMPRRWPPGNRTGYVLRPTVKIRKRTGQ